MPVAAGANLPYAAYAEVLGLAYEASDPVPTRWVYLRDYLASLSSEPTATDVLSADEWASLVAGEFEGSRLTTGVYRPSDPEPAAKLLETEFGRREYYCSC